MAEGRTTTNVAGVRYTPTGPVRYFDPGGHELSVGDRVLVETEEGQREGLVVIAPGQVLYSDLRGPLAPVVRKLDTTEDQ